MRTVTFKSVLEGVASKCGIQPALLTDELAQAYTENINLRMLSAWPFYDWPELTLIEERQFRANYDGGASYVVGDEVLYEEKYYRCIQDGTGKTPDTETAYWEEATDLDYYIAYEQSGENEISECFEVWRENPRVSTNPRKLRHSFSPNGVQIKPGQSCPAKVWVQYQGRPNQFTATQYSATIAYEVGQKVYYETTGECYKCVQNSTGNAPTETAYWEKIDFPYIFEAYAKLGAYADDLREDGENDKADRADTRAENLLEDKVLQYKSRQDQHRYVNKGAQV